MSKFDLVYDDVVNKSVSAFEQHFPETSTAIVELVSAAITKASESGRFYVEIPLPNFSAHEVAYVAILISNAGFHRVYAKHDDSGTNMLRVFWLEI